MSTCLTCAHWEARGVPRFAADMGMAYCIVKRTQSVTLPHWRACPQWQQTTPAAIDQRTAWLKRRGIDPLINQLKTIPA